MSQEAEYVVMGRREGSIASVRPACDLAPSISTITSASPGAKSSGNNMFT